jgi:hypothetical protein
MTSSSGHEGASAPNGGLTIESESSAVYQGDCPVRMRPNQAMLELDASGHAIDFMAKLAPQARAFEAKQAKFARQAPDAAKAAAPIPQKARIVSINAQFLIACGWIDVGGQDGIEPFLVSGFGKERPADFVVVVPNTAGKGLNDRVDGAFLKQLTLAACGERMPPKPPGFADDPHVDGPLRSLWSKPSPG